MAKVALRNKTNGPIVVSFKNGEETVVPPKGKTPKDIEESNIVLIKPDEIAVIR